MILAKATNDPQRTPWYTKAGAACSIVPISRFLTPTIFALKGGGYGCVFSLSGADEESLTDQELESRTRMIEGALRGMPEHSCLYEYCRVLNGYDLPRQGKYASAVTEKFVSDRLEYLDQRAGFRRIDLYWCLTVEPPKTAALKKKPHENAGDNARMLTNLQKAATILEEHLRTALGIRLLPKAEAFAFFSYLYNLEPWADFDRLGSDTGLDRQIVKSPVSWHNDHLQVGKRYVQMFSLMNTPDTSRPCQFSGLMTLDCDSVLCTSWRPKSATAARKEIENQEKFISFFKVGILNRVMSGKDTASLETGAGAKAAQTNVEELSEVINSLDRTAQGEYTMRLLLAARSKDELHNAIPAVHRIFVEARSQVMEETLGNLSSFYTMFPGNQKFNVFPLWLGEDHHARLSLAFAPHIGHPVSEDLDSEYLNVFETRTRTPFFQDVYVNGVRVMLILGPTGSGKTTTLEIIREGAEKSGYTVEGFAPTSKASDQLREAGINANTLQSFLQRTKPSDPDARHLYLLDESSLASSKQMRQFLDKVGPQDHIVVIGDIRQHQGVEAGRPFQQMQDAGMRTSQLDQIVRQKDPELLRAVEHLARNETERGVALLREQGRVTEIPNGLERIQAIARDYASKPESTIIVSPDNKSRQQLNEAVRVELKEKGVLSSYAETFRTLTNRNDMTGAERTWAARYEVGNILQYTTGSKAEGIAKDSFATVRSVDAAANRLTIELENGKTVSYDPKRLRGVNAYRESAKEIAAGDRIQFTTNDKKLDIRNRDLATIVSAAPGQITVRMDGKAERTVTFDPTKLRQFDHGYAVTSHSSQGLTQDRVLANFDTGTARSLVNTRLAYVAVSRASQDARIYTNDADSLGKRLSVDVSKTAAIENSRTEVKSELRQAVEGLRAGNTGVSIDKLKDQGRVYQHTHAAERIFAVAKEYAATRDRTVILSEKQSDRAAITAQIRSELQQAGRLAPDQPIRAAVLREQQFRQHGRAADYRPGDVIQYGKGSPKHGLLPKTEATVEAVDSRRNLIVVRTGQDDLVTYSPSRLKTATNDSRVYRPELQPIVQGERIRITRNDKELNVRAGDFATVNRTDDKGSLKVRLDNGKEIELTAKQSRHVEHGYAVESGSRVSAERFIVTGDTTETRALKSVPANARDLSVHITAPAIQQQNTPEREKAPQHEQAHKPPQREIQRGYGIGLSL